MKARVSLDCQDLLTSRYENNETLEAHDYLLLGRNFVTKVKLFFRCKRSCKITSILQQIFSLERHIQPSCNQSKTSFFFLSSLFYHSNISTSLLACCFGAIFKLNLPFHSRTLNRVTGAVSINEVTCITDSHHVQSYSLGMKVPGLITPIWFANEYLSSVRNFKHFSSKNNRECSSLAQNYGLCVLHKQIQKGRNTIENKGFHLALFRTGDLASECPKTATTFTPLQK